jgi:hypothetical protein
MLFCCQDLNRVPDSLTLARYILETFWSSDMMYRNRNLYELFYVYCTSTCNNCSLVTFQFLPSTESKLLL